MQKHNNLFTKLKEDKGARTIALTIAVMIVVLTAIIITTVVANRAANKGDEGTLPNEQVGITDPDDTTSDEKPDEKPEEKPSTGTDANALPETFLLPVSGVLQKGHDASIQVFSPTMGDYRIHLGIDIGTTEGASVCAMADGVIAQVWEDFSMGQCVAVKHSGEAYTIYKNLSVELPESVVVGASVKAGDVIGKVGNSARVEVSEEPHLHLEMTVGGLQVDPTEYLDEEAMGTLGEDTNYEDVS